MFIQHICQRWNIMIGLFFPAFLYCFGSTFDCQTLLNMAITTKRAINHFLGIAPMTQAVSTKKRFTFPSKSLKSFFVIRYLIWLYLQHICITWLYSEACHVGTELFQCWEQQICNINLRIWGVRTPLILNSWVWCGLLSVVKDYNQTLFCKHGTIIQHVALRLARRRRQNQASIKTARH